MTTICQNPHIRNSLLIVKFFLGKVKNVRFSLNLNYAGFFAQVPGIWRKSCCIKPKLIICADNDFASSIEAVEKGMLNIPDPKRLEIFENCDHFYIDKEHIIANKVHEFFILK